MSWGGLERPGRMVLEIHQGFDPPPECGTPDWIMYMVATIWFSDPELTAKARELGMPAFTATIDWGAEGTDNLKTHTWTWQTEGYEPSSLQFPQVQPPVDMIEGPTHYRFFWLNGTHANYLDFEDYERYDAWSSPMATGTLHEPAFFAESGLEQYVGVGEIDVETYFSSTIHRFKDLLCEEPWGG